MTALEKTVILYVEDDPGMAHLVQKRLEPQGYFVELCDTGKKGLRKYDKEVHDIVILDYNLPDMNGCEIIGALKDDEGNVPVIIMLTGGGNEKVAVEALKIGATDYLVKDVNQVFLELLPSVIEQALFSKELVEENEKQKKELEYYTKELEQRNEELKKLAHHDTLTGLANRAVFQDAMVGAMARANRNNQNMALLLIDLDGFKEINDTYGHIAGDLILKELSQRLKGVLRESDHIARIGGDEFAIVLEGLGDSHDAIVIASNLIKQMEYPVLIEDRKIYITISVGIACHPECGETSTQVIKSADVAMYLAKKEKGSTYHFFTEELNQKASESLELEHDLDGAVERGELLLYFQPKFSMRSMKIIGGEALARWNHPTKGGITPDIFIPIAERSMLIDHIGTWVLESACMNAKKWQAQSTTPITVSVNISPNQFGKSGFAEKMLTVLEACSFDPELLELEISETGLVKNMERCKEELVKLRKEGVKISIDDFGTGHSSIRHLKDFPVDSLKIDKSVIKNITEDNEDAAIANAMIDLARHMKLGVVAEGVETDEQMKFLRTKHCDSVQGFLLERPVPANDFIESIKSLREKEIA